MAPLAEHPVAVSVESLKAKDGVGSDAAWCVSEKDEKHGAGHV